MAGKLTAIVRRNPAERNNYVENNLRLVDTVAHKFFRGPTDPGVSRYFGQWSDVIQEGILALMKAGDTYDEAMGVPFENYACILIARALKRKTQRKRDVLRDSERLHNTIESNGSDVEAINILADKITISLDTVGDIKFLVGKLPKKSRELVNERFWLNRSFVEMAESRGQTPTSVMRALERTITRLKEMLEDV